MRIKRFNENLDYMKDDIRDHFPKNLQLYTSYGTHDYVLSDITRENSILRVTYFVNTPDETGGDVLADGDPDLMTFDIHVITDTRTNEIKLNVDMTHGDRVIYEFTIEAPNIVKVHFYDGIGSKADEDTHFGLSDESLDAMIKVFSSFNTNFELSRKDFTFMDKYPDSYQVVESAKITPLSQNQVLLIVNNTEPQKNRFLKNLLKYCRTRGIEHLVVSDITELNKAFETKKVVGTILTGSEYRINQFDDKLSKQAIRVAKNPILGICFGLQSMCKNAGVRILENDKLTLDHKTLTEYSNCKLFNGLDIKNMKLSFSFNDYPESCPSGYKVVGKLDNMIAAIADDKNERYGVLFHPEDVENSHKILDNFVSLCHQGQDEQEKILSGQFESVIRYKDFN